MKNKTNNYKKAPRDIARAITAAEPVKDFLPPPERLIRKEKTIKITISLTSDSFNFFKALAAKNSVPYQKMIRQLLDIYSKHYQ
jgi:predicted DNA binding CopG/RHH family protein